MTDKKSQLKRTCLIEIVGACHWERVCVSLREKERELTKRRTERKSLSSKVREREERESLLVWNKVWFFRTLDWCLALNCLCDLDKNDNKFCTFTAAEKTSKSKKHSFYEFVRKAIKWRKTDWNYFRSRFLLTTKNRLRANTILLNFFVCSKTVPAKRFFCFFAASSNKIIVKKNYFILLSLFCAI